MNTIQQCRAGNVHPPFSSTVKVRRKNSMRVFLRIMSQREKESMKNRMIDLNDPVVHRFIRQLLSDKTTKKNIIFATDSYAHLGACYGAENEISLEAVAFMDLKPRVLKSLEDQTDRTRKRAEVMSPVWLVCQMCRHIDTEWFGREDVFETMEGQKWTNTTDSIVFPEGKTWQEYVDSRRLEITCGEAPYIVSRYDTVTGQPIDIKDRVGMLDRKLRIVNENTSGKTEWMKWTLRAFQATYGYEFQGDNLVIARLNLMFTFLEYYEDRWHEMPGDEDIRKIVRVITWNIWQMDGLTGMVPYTAHEENGPAQMTFFDMGWMDEKPVIDDMISPVVTGVECRIYDWRSNESVTYNSLKGGSR